MNDKKRNYLENIVIIRAIVEDYFRLKDYDYFVEIFNIVVEELHDNFSSEIIDECYIDEINFYFKYSGLDNEDFLDKFSKNGYSLGLNDLQDEEIEYKSSDFINVLKFNKVFKKEFRELNKNEIKKF